MHYKIVRKINKRLVSMATPHWYSVKDPKKYIVEYKIGEFVKPQVHKSVLYVFDNYADAIYYKTQISLNVIGKFELYECEVESSSHIPPVMSASAVDRYWEARQKHKKIPDVQTVKIPGCVSCRAVKLLRKVK